MSVIDSNNGEKDLIIFENILKKVMDKPLFVLKKKKKYY